MIELGRKMWSSACESAYEREYHAGMQKPHTTRASISRGMLVRLL